MNTDRFAFGKNWQSFRKKALTEAHISEAETALEALVGIPLKGKTFLDIGSGSGLMSLSALRLGAKAVTSFDVDADSVACSEALRKDFAPQAPAWTVMQGSVLDKPFLAKLAPFDVVYSWGVLHHTGSMWEAVANAASLVAPSGLLVLALYNRAPEGPFDVTSETWGRIKRTYVRGGAARQAAMLGAFVAWRMAIALTKGRNLVREIRDYKSHRGMSWLHDQRDWVGGYPYEYATTQEVVAKLGDLGFDAVKTLDNGGYGCNQFVFRKRSESPKGKAKSKAN